MKKQIRIFMIHTCVYNSETLYKYLQINNPEKMPFEFVWDDEKPEYLIATEQIYTHASAWKKFVNLSKNAKIFIYRSLECTVGDLNIFDYVIGFDKYLKCGDRIGRTPTRLFFAELISKKANELCGDFTTIRHILQQKPKFCNFIYSNGEGHWYRKFLFDEISKYKRVDSLGHFLNNTDVESEKYGGEWAGAIQECRELKKPYKFSIACENAKYVGYTSEKIFSSLEAHTIPIYWGNPDIEEEINPKAFINCNNYETQEELINAIRKIDEDDRLWCEMIAEPWMTESQLIREQEAIQEYYHFITHIFMQPIESAARKGEGFHPKRYMNWFYNNGIEIRNKCNDILKTKWLDLIYSGGRSTDYLNKKGYKDIAIYGAGKSCEWLVKDLKTERICIEFIIDQSKRGFFENVPIVGIDEIKKYKVPEVVIISLPYVYEEVKQMLELYMSCDIVSISKLVEETD